jgi:hypothetical protein
MRDKIERRVVDKDIEVRGENWERNWEYSRNEEGS